MRDAMGGIVNIALIVVFLVIIMGYLAFNINYMKAFKVKNKIITTFEQYEGVCIENKDCKDIIVNYMKEVGYNTNFEWRNLDSSYTRAEGFAYKKVENDSNPGEKDNRKFYYKIVTQITVDIPIINKVLNGMDTFRITGDTKSFAR